MGTGVRGPAGGQQKAPLWLWEVADWLKANWVYLETFLLLTCHSLSARVSHAQFHTGFFKLWLGVRYACHADQKTRNGLRRNNAQTQES